MDPVRCFVALDVSDSVRTALGETVDGLKRVVDGVRWVRPENVHLTLKFLGDVDRSRLTSVASGLSAIENSQAVRLRLTSLGGFPRRDRARVIWVGLDGDLDPLNRLQHTIETQMEEQGFSRETRDFRPHLTVGRARKSPVQIPDIPVSDVGFEGSVVSLIQSRIQPAGAVYTPIEAISLAGA